MAEATGEREGAAAESAVMAAALYAGGEWAFAGAAGLLDLVDAEHEALRAAVLPALAIINPCFSYVDAGAWRAALLQGALDASNGGIGRAMAGCTDLVLGAKKPIWLGRPDRYYGRPVAQLTDGQLLAFEAVHDHHHQ